jgi:hypothetical protein
MSFPSSFTPLTPSFSKIQSQAFCHMLLLFFPSILFSSSNTSEKCLAKAYVTSSFCLSCTLNPFLSEYALAISDLNSLKSF